MKLIKKAMALLLAVMMLSSVIPDAFAADFGILGKIIVFGGLQKARKRLMPLAFRPVASLVYGIHV